MRVWPETQFKSPGEILSRAPLSFLNPDPQDSNPAWGGRYRVDEMEGVARGEQGRIILGNKLISKDLPLG